jgi:transposase
MSHYFVGIDWGQFSHKVCILNSSGDSINEFSIDNNKEGFFSLLDKLQKLSDNPSDFSIAIENAGLPIVNFLQINSYSVYLVPPAKVDSLRTNYSSSNAKSDELDAYILADALRTSKNKYALIKPNSKLTQEISLTISYRDTLLADRTIYSNRLTQCLREYYPLALELFNDIDRPTALDFLQAYSDYESAKKLSQNDIEDFLGKRKANRLNRKEFYQKIQNGQIPVDPIVAKANTTFMLTLVAHLKLLNTQIDTYEENIMKLVDIHNDTPTFTSIPGVSSILSAELIASLGDDKDAFSDATQLQSLFGTSPVTRRSGNYKHFAFRFACNKQGRNTLHQIAFVSIRTSAWAKNYYLKKRNEGKTHNHALRCLANIWLKIIFKLWKNKQKYDENIHLASITKHNLQNQNKNSKKS